MHVDDLVRPSHDILVALVESLISLLLYDLCQDLVVVCLVGVAAGLFGSQPCALLLRQTNALRVRDGVLNTGVHLLVHHLEELDKTFEARLSLWLRSLAQLLLRYALIDDVLVPLFVLLQHLIESAHVLLLW